jgi:hypothetical protein
MALYNITYQFESDGGNIQYKTIQNVKKEADTSGVDLTIVTSGLALDDEVMRGIAVVELEDDADPAVVFKSAANVDKKEVRGNSSDNQSDESTSELPSDPDPAQDISRVETDQAVARSLAEVSETPGRGAMFYSNLSRCQPFERDLWFVPISETSVDNSDVSYVELVEFYCSHLELLQEQPSLKIGVYHQASNSRIQLSLVASLTDQQEASELAAKVDGPDPMNFYRFELSKLPLVVGETTHGPGSFGAVFRNKDEEEVISRDLAYQHWHEGLTASYHPLGVLVDGTLYQPVSLASDDIDASAVGDPITLETYRGSKTSRPWQFGLTRYDDQLLITQARASPDKFDPVLKRYPIEKQTLDDEPLVFSHTVSRRVWSEDPLNLHVQSQRSEGLRTQFIYEDSDGWHLRQPKGVEDPDKSADPSFESTQLDGVSVRSALLRVSDDGDVKATVEHEYRITEDVFDACDQLYALSYYEANEESFDNLQWDIADATAYEIVNENTV